jgi:dihydroxy-acid dehydratase
LIENDDLIEADIPAKRLTLHLDEAALQARREKWVPFEHPVPHGFMRRCRQRASPASHGAVIG